MSQKANWVVVNPESGQGNASVSVSSQAEHTGRVARQTVLTLKAADCEDVLVNVNQQGKPELVENDSDTATAAKAGQVVTISGISNSTKLTFSIGVQGNTLELEAPETYNVGGVDVANGAAIEGDPGASAVYNWSVRFTIPINDTINTKTAQIIVTDAGGHTDTCVLTQAAGDARISVSTNSIELDYLGTPVSFNVESNTSWTIS